MMNCADALDVAYRIATRVAKAGIWTDEGCTWEITVNDRDAPIGVCGSKRETAGAWIYSGTSGIGLFLLEAFHQTGDEFLLAAANGAMKYANFAIERQLRFGFHSGPVGVAYANARFGTRLNRSADYDAASRILASLESHEHRDTSLDVIGGGAGAIPPLLQLSEILGDERPLTMAVRLGENLLHRAKRGHDGWSWGIGVLGPHNLTGYAHGAAGVAHALLELYAATRRGDFLYAATQAVAFEQSYYDSSLENWPDFRHMGLTEFIPREARYSPEERAAAIEALEPYQLRFMSAWCHGAAGIGLSRLRFVELLGSETYARGAAAAVRTVLRSLDGDSWRIRSFSLCHGTAGDCETLLMAARVLDDEAAAAAVAHVATAAAELFERAGKHWVSGVLGGVSDPSLMVGDAGIGYFYLRLASPETPSILLPTTSVSPVQVPDAACEAAAQSLRRDYVDAHFNRILEVIGRIDGDIDRIRDAGRAREAEPEIASMYDAIVARIDAETSPATREKIIDAFAPERARFEFARTGPNWTIGLIESLQREVRETEGRERIGMADHVQFVPQSWNWDAWLSNDEDSSPDAIEEGSEVFVVWPSRDSIKLQSLSPLADSILQIILEHEETTAARILDEVVHRIDFENLSSTDAGSIRSAVDQQLNHLAEAGLIRRRVRAERKSIREIGRAVNA